MVELSADLTAAQKAARLVVQTAAKSVKYLAADLADRMVES